jgi:hypothetical protein
MSLKTGSKPWRFEANQKIEIVHQGRLTIFAVDENGEFTSMVTTSESGRLKFRTKDAFDGFIQVQDETMHWAMEVIDLPSPFDKSDPIPIEVPEDKKQPLSLEDKLRRMLAGMVAERYGADSAEMDTFEDAMDFDDDDEINPVELSGYEVQDMIPDNIVDTHEPTSPPAEQVPDQQQSSEPAENAPPPTEPQ